jgi:hypothetical protein
LLLRTSYIEGDNYHRRKETLTKEIENWKVFADSLKSEKDKKLFLEMLEKCHKYALAINAKGKPFPTEPLIMALLLEQHKMINWLQKKIPIPKQRFFKV